MKSTEVNSFRTLRDYLIEKIPEWSGHPVRGFDIKLSDEPFVRVRLRLSTGRSRWFFFGFLSDVQASIDAGHFD